jgi:hypothetical protein
LGAHFHFHDIPDGDLDEVLTQLPRYVGKDLVTILKLRSKHGTGQDRGDLAFDFDNFFSRPICKNPPSHHLGTLSQVSPFIKGRNRYYAIHHAKAYPMSFPQGLSLPTGKGKPLFHAVGVQRGNQRVE